MVFSSSVFLWVFLPMVLVMYKISNPRIRNTILLITSIAFYSFGEPKYVLLMVTSIAINYILGIFIDYEEEKLKRKIYLIMAVVINLGLLGYFKYFNFLLITINDILSRNVLTVKEIALPVGISFYTFQALSYVVDVYRSKENNGEVKAQRNIFNLALYISFFPQLIAGPIVKYRDIDKQIISREESVIRTAYGIKRFIYGISKKVLISNPLALVADEVFAVPISGIGTSIAWLGIICYTLQIYFDFSGYSDMAIGLGEMFGFKFMENFNYPYISRSIQEFWRRWHISLSTWFKEYVYIPLGGNRKGVKRTYINLFIVFLLTGLWHGASLTFIVWGIYHGIFMVIERLFLGEVLEKNKYKFINHIYAMLVITFGWVFFRADDIKFAIRYIKRLIIPTASSALYNINLFINREVIFILIVGILLCGVIQSIMPKFKERMFISNEIRKYEIVIMTILLFFVIVSIASGTYNPFIYFRF